MIQTRLAASLFAIFAIGILNSAADAADRAERLVSYAKDGAQDPDRSFDLYPSSRPGKDRALVVFLHSRFWRERQPSRWIEDAFVPGLLKAGFAVAILRHRLLPEGRHPVAIQDAARGVAALLDRVEAGEFDPERVFLAGHSSGAQLALLLALDAGWLRAEGKSPEALAGIVSISGILDLLPRRALSDEEEAIYATAFPDQNARRNASPFSHANASRPAILLLTAARDVPGYRNAAVRLADSLRTQGPKAAEAFVANGRDHFSILALDDPDNDARRHIFEFLDSDPRAGRLPDSWRVLATWRDPPFTSEDFFVQFPELIKEYSADDRFHQIANRPFQTQPRAPHRLIVQRYQAIDLVRLVEAMGASRVGTGEWLELRNVRGEWARFSFEELRRLAPRLVIGVDSERNLFKATDLYHTLRRYSWVEPEPIRVDMARPLGAFLYFPGEAPPLEAGSGHFGRYALTIDSFRRVTKDPMASLSDLPGRVRKALISSPACIACHQFRDVGGRALHIRAADGSAMGGRALPLERYPPIVWKRFIFDQAQVAREVGASPIAFRSDVARALHDFVALEKNRRRIKAWTHPDRDRVPK